MAQDEEEGSSVVSFDEIAALEAEEKDEGEEGKEKPEGATAADLFNQRLDGENVPEAFRGKSISEMLQRSIAMEQALKISEESRQAITRVADRGMVQQPVQVQEEPLTKQKLAEMMQEDPVATVALMIDKGLLRGFEHVEKRLAPMADSGRQSAERTAREQYKLEFELFGPQIQEFTDGLTDKSGLQNPKAWDDIISYIRGRSDNLPKYIQAVTKSSNGKETARESQRSTAGFSPSTVQRGSVATQEAGDDGMDDTERKIAQSFIDSGTFKNMAEYNKWKRM